jgi:pimeloyl-ACP methyl ester carboxylesterase
VGLAELPRLAALVARLARFSPDAGPDSRVDERRGQRTADGLVFDDYRPRERTTGTGTLVHGMSPEGAADPLVVHFARNVAVAGVRCIVPTLPGLADCRWDPRDLDVLARSVALAAEAGPGRPGLVGFSYGATHALAAAVRADVAPHLRFVLVLGSCDSVEQLHADYRDEWAHALRDDAEEDDRIYAQLVLAWRHRDALGLDDGRRGELRDLLRRFCHASSLEEKRRFHAAHLADLDLLALEERDGDCAAYEALSLRGKLSRIACPVRLVHDRHDHVVPCGHSERLFAELKALPGGERHGLLITSLLGARKSVVLPRPTELVRMFAALAPLLRPDVSAS